MPLSFLDIIGFISMKIFTDKPLVSKEVLTYLEQQFPDRLPKDETVSLDTIRFLQGQQSVLEKVRQLTEFENEDEDVCA